MDIGYEITHLIYFVYNINKIVYNINKISTIFVYNINKIFLFTIMDKN